jgi:hypothetical protein
MFKIKIDVRCNYIAEDQNGTQYLYEVYPSIEEDFWDINRNKLYCTKTNTFNLDLGDNWKDSLHKLIRDDQGYIIDVQKITARPNLSVDTKVICKSDNEEVNRYFSHFPDDPSVPGIYVFLNGKTSWSSDENYKAYYRKWEIYTEHHSILS